ncbi:MAG: SPFH/Band 7/PHB domain protein [Lachnospiraceae bacterium]|nr:SPFH/Band 7/PHB domain protein [Lachnospiraceae bacterium]
MQALTGTIIFVIFLFIIILFKSLCIVPQASAYIVEELGKYKTTLSAGLNFMWPFIDRVVKKVSLKEQVADFEPQPVITKDNVTMMVDSVVFFQVFNAELFTYGVERPIAAIENLSATTLRNIIGSMTLDETLTSRDNINAQITSILDEATDKWGIKVSRVEVKNIQPPRSIQDAMEKQMRAEREKREAILTAEGKKQSAITLAEGEKQAAILRAEAVKEQRIREAEGEAEALLAVQRARAESIKLINEANPSRQYLQLKSYETAEKMADGQATKIIVPSDVANLSGTLTALTEVVKTPGPGPHPPIPHGTPVPAVRREACKEPAKGAEPRQGIIDRMIGE